MKGILATILLDPGTGKSQHHTTKAVYMPCTPFKPIVRSQPARNTATYRTTHTKYATYHTTPHLPLRSPSTCHTPTKCNHTHTYHSPHMTQGIHTPGLLELRCCQERKGDPDPGNTHTCARSHAETLRHVHTYIHANTQTQRYRKLTCTCVLTQVHPPPHTTDTCSHTCECKHTHTSMIRLLLP